MGCLVAVILFVGIWFLYSNDYFPFNETENPIELVDINSDMDSHICYVDNNNEEILSTFNSKSARDCAKFYLANQNKCESVGSVYKNEILPLVFNGSNFDIVETYKVLKTSPIIYDLDKYVVDGKQKVVTAIESEVAHNANKEYFLFVENFVPLLFAQVDSIVEADVKELLEDIDDDDKLNEVFDDYIKTKKYDKIINEYLSAYSNVLFDQINQDYYDLTGEKCDYRDSLEMLSVRGMHFKCTSDMLDTYSEHAVYRDSIYWREKLDMAIDVLTVAASEIPYVGPAVEVASGLYTAYSLYEVLTEDDYYNLNPTERFVMCFEGELEEQIHSYVENEVGEQLKLYLMYYNDVVYKNIKNKVTL